MLWYSSSALWGAGPERGITGQDKAPTPYFAPWRIGSKSYLAFVQRAAFIWAITWGPSVNLLTCKPVMIVIFLFFLPLTITVFFILWQLKNSNFISTLYDNSINFHGNNENLFWLPYLKKLILIVCGFLCIRGLISYSLFITKPNYHYFLPMQIIMMPFILLLIFNTWHLFNFANGMKKQSSDKLKKMYNLLKIDFFHLSYL